MQYMPPPTLYSSEDIPLQVTSGADAFSSLDYTSLTVAIRQLFQSTSSQTWSPPAPPSSSAVTGVLNQSVNNSVMWFSTNQTNDGVSWAPLPGRVGESEFDLVHREEWPPHLLVLKGNTPHMHK